MNQSEWKRQWFRIRDGTFRINSHIDWLRNCRPCASTLHRTEFKCDLCGFGVPKISMGDFNTGIMRICRLDLEDEKTPTSKPAMLLNENHSIAVVLMQDACYLDRDTDTLWSRLSLFFFQPISDEEKSPQRKFKRVVVVFFNWWTNIEWNVCSCFASASSTFIGLKIPNKMERNQSNYHHFMKRLANCPKPVRQFAMWYFIWNYNWIEPVNIQQQWPIHNVKPFVDAYESTEWNTLEFFSFVCVSFKWANGRFATRWCSRTMDRNSKFNYCQFMLCWRDIR